MSKTGIPDQWKKITQHLPELDLILSDKPLIDQRIREIIEYQLKKGMNSSTYGYLLRSLETLVGGNVARAIIWPVRFNTFELFEYIKKQHKDVTIDKVLPFLKYLTALYGDELELAYLIFRENPNDWTHSTTKTFREVGEKETWFIESYIEKVDGGKVYLRMPPWSLLVLVERLLGEIIKTPKEGIKKRQIKRFNDLIKDFQKKFLVGSSKEN